MESDSDNDEDSYVTIGTPFEVPDEDQPRKKPLGVEDQFAVDSRGRRRFHGAFTGGFSAGYFNSVGSKEGFTPATFTSSRTKKHSESESQRPEDFMDDEDFGEFGIAPKQVFTRGSFTSGEKEVQRKRAILDQAVKEGVIQSAIPGGFDHSDFILPTQISIGVSLLNMMGWKEGQGVGEKQNRKVTSAVDDLPQEILFAPKDVVPINFLPKDNFHGIGYSGIDPAKAVFTGASSLAEIFKPTGKEKRGIRGQAFGVGAFEDDDEDIYERDNMAEYDMTIGFDESNDTRKFGWSGPPIQKGMKGCLIGFVKAKQVLASVVIYPAPTLPRNYDGRHKITSSQISSEKNTVEVSNSGQLTARERSLMLSDQPSITDDRKVEKKKAISLIGSSKEKTHTVRRTRWDTPVPEEETDVPKNLIAAEKKASPTNKTQNLTSSKAVDLSVPSSSKEQTATPLHSSFKPFSKDKAKQQRYEQFLESQKSGNVLNIHYDGSMTEWEKERELEEFLRAASLYRPLSRNMAARFTHPTPKEDITSENSKEKSDRQQAAAMGMYGKLTRMIYEWHPDGLLCKRLNVPEPFPGSRRIGIYLEPKPTNSHITDARYTGNEKTPSVEAELKEQEEMKLPWTQQNIKELSYGPSRYKKIVKKFTGEKLDAPTVEDKETSEVVLDKTDQKAQPTDKTKIVIGPLSHLNELINKNITEHSDSSDDELYDKEKRPSMDFFKAIFADSDQSESFSMSSESEGKASESEMVDKLKNKPEKNLENPDKTVTITTLDTPLQDRSAKNIIPDSDKAPIFFCPKTSLLENKTLPSTEKDESNMFYGPEIPTFSPNSVAKKEDTSHDLNTSVGRTGGIYTKRRDYSQNEKHKKKKKYSRKKHRKSKYRESSDGNETDSENSEFIKGPTTETRDSYTKYRERREKKKRIKHKKKHSSHVEKNSSDEFTSDVDGGEQKHFKAMETVSGRWNVTNVKPKIVSEGKSEKQHRHKKKKKKYKSKYKIKHMTESSHSESESSSALGIKIGQEGREGNKEKCSDQTEQSTIHFSNLIVSDNVLAEKLKKHRSKLKGMTKADFM